MSDIEIRCAGCDLPTEAFIVVDKFGAGARLCPECEQMAREEPMLTLDDLRELRVFEAESDAARDSAGPRSDAELDASEQQDVAAFFNALGHCRDEPESDEAQDVLAAARRRVSEQAMRHLRAGGDLPRHYRHLFDLDRTLFMDLAVTADEEQLPLPADLAERYQLHLTRIDEEMKSLLQAGLAEDDAATVVCALEEARAGRAVSVAELRLSAELMTHVVRCAASARLAVRFRE